FHTVHKILAGQVNCPGTKQKEHHTERHTEKPLPGDREHNGAYNIARPARVRTSKAKGLARRYRGQDDPEHHCPRHSMRMLSLLTWALLGEEDGYSPMTISFGSLMNLHANSHRDRRA